MSGYTPLFGEIVTSSIWNEPDSVRIVWITLMALADMDGNVMASVAGLAPVARVSIPECEKAIGILSAPDKYSRSQEQQGRRIEVVDGGWHIINHKKYREKAKSRAEYYRKYREEKKKKQKEKNNTNSNAKANSNSATDCNVAQHGATSCKYTMKFDEFWQLYPKKVGKGKARESYLKLKPSDKLQAQILKAVTEQKVSDQWTKENGQYIPNPATWLNQERWGDELPHKETIAEMHKRLKDAGEI